MNYFFRNTHRQNNTSYQINYQRSSTSTSTLPSISRSSTNRTPNFTFNNGYNRRSTISSSESNVSPSPSPPSLVLVPQDNSMLNNSLENNIVQIQYNYMNNIIDISANNISDRNEANEYYSSFVYNDLNINFYHNILLNNENTDFIINNLLENLNNAEINNLLDNLQDSIDNSFLESQQQNSAYINNEKIIQNMNNNISEDKYINCKSKLKNNICPILLEEFSDNDEISIFELCNHAIFKDVKEKYLQTFIKCPLCNCKLIT